MPPDGDPAPNPTPATPPAPAPQPQPTPRVPDPDDEEEYPGLNAAGRQAVAAMHVQRKQLRTDLRAAQTKIGELEQERDRLKGSSQQVANLKRGLLENAVAAAAAGRLADPQDAMRLVDISDITVGDDGKVDSAKLKDRIDKLLEQKPYLAAGTSTTTRSSGTANGGRPPGLPGGGQRQAPTGGDMNARIREAFGR